MYQKRGSLAANVNQNLVDGIRSEHGDIFSAAAAARASARISSWLIDH